MYACLVVKSEDDAVAQLVLIRAQRTQLVAEALGQHGYGAVNEIDTGGALFGFAVHDVMLLDVVGHIGNVHSHLVERRRGGQCAEGERIVKVLGILRVDGEGEHLPEILAALQVGCSDGARYLGGSLHHALRVGVWQSVFGQYGVHLHGVVAMLSQHVNHLSHDGLLLGRGPLRDFHHGHVAVLAALQLLLGYDDVVNKDVALGLQEGEVGFHHQPSHGLVHLVRQYVGDDGLLDVVLSAGHIDHSHAVAVEGELRVALGHEDRRAAVVGLEGVLAVGLAYEGALRDLCTLVEAVAAVAVFRQEVVPRHVFQQVNDLQALRVLARLEVAEHVARGEYLCGVGAEECFYAVGKPLLVEFAFALFHRSEE